MALGGASARANSLVLKAGVPCLALRLTSDHLTDSNRPLHGFLESGFKRQTKSCMGKSALTVKTLGILSRYLGHFAHATVMQAEGVE